MSVVCWNNFFDNVILDLKSHDASGKIGVHFKYLKICFQAVLLMSFNVHSISILSL